MRIIIQSCLDVTACVACQIKPGRGESCGDKDGGKAAKMTLMEPTTATLNVLHYKICDKTLLWRGCKCCSLIPRGAHSAAHLCVWG